MKIKLFSFFSGCGLLDLGMEEAGFDIAMVSEKYQPFLDAYKYSREKMQISDKEVKKFYAFVDIYDKFKNEENVTLDLSLEERNLYDLFKKYKQASSEGTRKLINRMARFDVLKHFLLEDDSTDELVSSLCEKLEKM